MNQDDVEEDGIFIFYADCHGLVSVTPWSPTSFHAIQMVIMSNEQRWGVAGTLHIKESVANGLHDMCSEDATKKEALKLIKESKYNLPAGKVKAWSRRLEMIPDDKLDPHWHPKEVPA